MKKTNALQMRQSLGSILAELQKTGEPILVEKDRQAVAVLITLLDYKKRFADYDARDERQAIVDRILSANGKLPKGIKSGLDLIRELRR